MRAVKFCKACATYKPLDEFYAHKNGAMGASYQCKPCTLARVAAHRSANLENVRARERALVASPQRVAKHKQLVKKYAETHPERAAAKRAVRIAIDRGDITKLPCWVCGYDETDAHHADYAQPLSVTFLCRVHHKQVHAMVRS